MKISPLQVACLWLAVLALVVPNASAQGIRLHGSTSLAKLISDRQTVLETQIPAKLEGVGNGAGRGLMDLAGGQADIALNGIVKVRHVDDLVSEVSTASREQTSGIAQINSAVSQMDKVTQGNAANAEESAAAARDLSGQAEVIKQTVLQRTQLIDKSPA